MAFTIEVSVFGIALVIWDNQTNMRAIRENAEANDSVYVGGLDGTDRITIAIRPVSLRIKAEFGRLPGRHCRSRPGPALGFFATVHAASA